MAQSSGDSSPKLGGAQAWLIWVIAVIFVVYLFSVQTGYAIVAGDMQKDIGLSVTQIATIAATYTWVFALFQFYGGALLDQLGSRLVLPISIALVTLGVFVYAHAKSFEILVMLAAFAALGSGNLEFMLAVIFLTALQASFFSPAHYGILPELLPESQNDTTALLAISCDPMHSLRAFAEADGLTFPLLSDHWPHGGVASAYGVFNETTGAANRSTFILDQDGRVSWTVHNEIPQARSLDDYRAALGKIPK